MSTNQIQLFLLPLDIQLKRSKLQRATVLQFGICRDLRNVALRDMPVIVLVLVVGVDAAIPGQLADAVLTMEVSKVKERRLDIPAIRADLLRHIAAVERTARTCALEPFAAIQEG